MEAEGGCGREALLMTASGPEMYGTSWCSVLSRSTRSRGTGPCEGIPVPATTRGAACPIALPYAHRSTASFTFAFTAQSCYNDSCSHPPRQRTHLQLVSLRLPLLQHLLLAQPLLFVALEKIQQTT